MIIKQGTNFVNIITGALTSPIERVATSIIILWVASSLIILVSITLITVALVAIPLIRVPTIVVVIIIPLIRVVVIIPMIWRSVLVVTPASLLMGLMTSTSRMELVLILFRRINRYWLVYI